MINRVLFSAFLLLLTISLVQAQIKKDAPLYKELKKLDSIFFERGFNQCDLAYLEKTVSKDLEFYHDQSGFQDRETFFENTKKNLCSSPDKKPIRKLEEVSLTVFPLYNDGELYAAIQSGSHHFYIREKDKEDVWTGTAKFTSVWVVEDEMWKLREVLSYDHAAPRPAHEEINKIEQLLENNNVPALGLGIIENGKLKRIEVYGSLDGKKPAPYNTIFKVASLTKPVVALTTLNLIDKGILGLDEPLYKYWIDPDITDNDKHKKLTPRMVLTHQTGFPNWRYLTEDNKLVFQFEPGTKFQYSGEGFEYLRKAIERKTGRTIEDLAAELTFAPSGMTDTRFWWNTAMDESRYAQNFDAAGEQIPTEKYYEANAAANLLTTVEDYGKFLEYVLDGAELSEPLFQEMLTRQVQLKENDFFGLGWEILTGFSNEEYALLHTGKDPGVNTLAVLFPKSKNGYLIFLNGDNMNPVYEELLTNHLYLGKELWGMK